MHRISLTAVVAACLVSFAFSAAGASKKTGEELFSNFCAECHPNGKNILVPERTLDRETLEKRNIRTVTDIVNKMRNRGPFAAHPQSRVTMKRFTDSTVSDEEAVEIAKYVMRTFK